MNSSEAPLGRPLRLVRSPGFRAWLEQHDISLAISTYQAGRLLLIGRTATGLSLESRPFRRCMGLWASTNWGTGSAAPGPTELWVASRYELVQLQSHVPPEDFAANQPAFGEDPPDTIYRPNLRFATGNLDTHDVISGPHGVVFVNTRFSCLAMPDPEYQFRATWKPAFIQRISADDRCHLNGLAHRKGTPALVTACSTGDEPRGWRNHRAHGGCVIDVASNDFVARGLSMPHSPRLRDETLWILESGSGYLGTIDPENGLFQPHVFCPGYLRGLAFVDRFALIGSSLIRRPESLEGLSLGENLHRHRATAVCGVFVVDLVAGRLVHWLRIEGHIKELYDVVVLPGARRPALLGNATGTGPTNIRYTWQDRVFSCRTKTKP